MGIVVTAHFFFQKGRDFWHFYFCVGNLPVLQKEVALRPK